MSSLINNYRKLTNPINQGVFDSEESLLRKGRVYQANKINIVFEIGGVVDFILMTGSDRVTVYSLDFVADTEEFKVEFFVQPTITGAGSNIPLIQQYVGHPRSSLITAQLNPTITNTGTEGSKKIVHGIAGQGNRASLAEGVREALTLIDPGLTLLMRVTNNGVAEGLLDFNGRFSEEPI